MRAVTVILTSIAMAAGTLWYLWLVSRNVVKPVLTAWLIFSTTMTLSFVAYWHSPVHSFVGNIGNLTGVASTTSIFLIVLWKETREHGLLLRFNSFQKKCLALAGMIMVVWWVLRFIVGSELAAAISNVLTQFLMILGYVALAEKLWRAESTTEPVFTWAMLCLGSMLALFPAVMESDLLGFIYGVRASATSGITVWLILRVRSRGLVQGAS